MIPKLPNCSKHQQWLCLCFFSAVLIYIILFKGELLILSDAESSDDDLEKVIFETAQLESLSNVADHPDSTIQVTNSTTTTSTTATPGEVNGPSPSSHSNDSTRSGPYESFTKFPIYGEDRFCSQDRRQKLGVEYKTATVFGLYNTGTNLLLQLLQYVCRHLYIHLLCDYYHFQSS